MTESPRTPKIEVFEQSKNLVCVYVDTATVAKFMGEDARYNADRFAALLRPVNTAEPYPDWLVDIVQAFSPVVIPVDITPEGTYLEATTRWAMNPVYEHVPEGVRALVESAERPSTVAGWNKLREAWADADIDSVRVASKAHIEAERDRVGVDQEHENRRRADV